MFPPHHFASSLPSVLSSRFPWIRLAIGLAVFCCAAQTDAQTVSFTSSNLPIVILDTEGQSIPDEPKITAQMQIIDNGPGTRNVITDTPTGYDGFIGIEVRGSTSQAFPKKQYGVETRDEAGDNLNVSLLGMPEENDWILYAPYSDKSLMRNVLAYELANRMGRYASRTRFCEVVLNGDYQGVYVLMESIKRDSERVDINNLKDDEISGDDLTGGYLIRIDRRDGSPGEGWESAFPPAHASNASINYQYREPDAEDIVPEQVAYIQSFIEDFETTMDSETFDDPVTGYPSIVDLGSFVDFFLVNEIAKNVDGYRLSTYLHKDKDSNDPLLHAGPVWDFNIAFGNANYNFGDEPEGLHVTLEDSGDYPIAFWWNKMAQSDPFQDALALRWAELREGVLHPDSLTDWVDDTATLLDEAQARNFERWPVLGEFVWPNVDGFETRTTYASEVAQLKQWLQDRGEALNAVFPVDAAEAPQTTSSLRVSTLGPNPARGTSRISVALASPQSVTLDVFDLRGRHVARLHDGMLPIGATSFTLDTHSLSAGLYLIRAVGEQSAATERLMVMGR
ncbi:MAG: CotH kinase family protein [Rubricoccaceae bacterium]